MAQYLGTVKLGGFYNNGAALARPTKPWRNDSAPSGASSAGNIPSMSGSISNYSFGNTPSDDAKKLQWVKIKDGDKTLLICDRVILVNVTWNDLNSAGWIFGKEVTIDGAKYKLRSLTGGSNYRNTSDAYAGGTPTNNEWDRFITREEVITGLPAPVSSDLDSNLNSTDFTSVRVFSFSKKETVIKFELAAPEETDAAATKVLVTPTWKIEGAVAKVEACNNGFDAVPTWEDITAMVQINRVYNFTNKTKTASKWGVNIRFTITKNEGFEGEVSISGFGGAYE